MTTSTAVTQCAISLVTGTNSKPQISRKTLVADRSRGMPIAYQLVLQMAYEMPAQTLAYFQATFERVKAIWVMLSEGLAKRCEANIADDRPVHTDEVIQARATLVGDQD
ncbi:hypothetical protein [Pseudomonas putida]|uniref:hypothetical protein n=1 Tax=Pseudomonas putida TaxID=303 RepID=UPI000376821B|nr:hypothetical protein [Pseudomonas putida]